VKGTDMILLLSGVFLALILGLLYGYRYGVIETERRWSEAVERRRDTER